MKKRQKKIIRSLSAVAVAFCIIFTNGFCGNFIGTSIRVNAEEPSLYEYVALVDTEAELEEICATISGQVISYELGVAVIEAGYLEEEDRYVNGIKLDFNEVIEADFGDEFVVTNDSDDDQLPGGDSGSATNYQLYEEYSDYYTINQYTSELPGEEIDSGFDSYVQYHRSLLELDKAWEITKGNGIRVAVIDSGIDTGHPALLANIEEATTVFKDSDYTSASSTLYDGDLGRAYDYYGHGTAVAGLIAANSSDDSIMGVAPEAKIISIKTFEVKKTEAKTYSTTSLLFEALRMAMAKKVDVINLSISVSSMSSSTAATLKSLIDEAEEKGIIVVCASGNQSNSSPAYPGRYDSAIAIGAVGYAGDKLERCYFSNYGEGLDFVMPGKTIESTRPASNPRGITQSKDGTSFSSPMAAGVFALLLSKHPEMTKSELYDVLKATAIDLGDEGYDLQYGNGMMMPYDALKALENYVPTPTPEPTPLPTPDYPQLNENDGPNSSTGGESDDEEEDDSWTPISTPGAGIPEEDNQGIVMLENAGSKMSGNYKEGHLKDNRKTQNDSETVTEATTEDVADADVQVELTGEAEENVNPGEALGAGDDSINEGALDNKGEEESNGAFNILVPVIIIIAVAALLALFIILFIWKKRKEDEEKEG